MEKQPRELFEQMKADCKKKSRKVLLIPEIICIVLMIAGMIGFSIYLNVYIGCGVFGGGLIVVVLSFTFLPIMSFNNLSYTETVVDGLQIASFIEPSIGLGQNAVIIHLVVDGKDYSKVVGLKYYPFGGGTTTIGKVINIVELANYFSDYVNDTKKNLNVAIFTKKLSEKKISAIYDKYTTKLAIVVDGQICK